MNYIPALENNMIMPYKLNTLHYQAFQNNPESLSVGLSSGTKYGLDKFEMTPLQYAMQRKSFECT